MLDQMLQKAMSEIPNCVAVGAVDLNAGTLLAMVSREDRSQEMLNIVTSTVAELFEAPLLQAFSEVYGGEAEGAQAAGRPFSELLLMNNQHNYLLLRGRSRARLAVIVVTTKETPVGLLMMRSIAIMPEIENAV